MTRYTKKISLISRSLKHKLWVSTFLMSVLPLLVFLYLESNYILSAVGWKLDILASILLSGFIALTGFLLVKEVFDRILTISVNAKLIANGDLSRKLHTGFEHEDEIGDLTRALNQLASRIRRDMDELKSYSEKTSQINVEIQQHVAALSNLLQISYLIAQGAALDDLLKLITEKSQLLSDAGVSYLLFREESKNIFYVKEAEGRNADALLKIEVRPEEGIFDLLTKSSKPLIVDDQYPLAEPLAVTLKEKFQLKNILTIPIYLKGRITAVLGIGNNREQFLYKKDTIKLLDVFAKQVAIAIENDMLVHRLEKLEIKDTLTGLYNEAFILNRLHEEIKRAITYQRPCSLVILSIDNFETFRNSFGPMQSEATLKKVASLIRDLVTEIDRVARIQDSEFAIVLPEKNKRQAQRIGEEIRKKIEFDFSQEQDSAKRLTLAVGVSENPLDGVQAEELIIKAKEALKVAKG